MYKRQGLHELCSIFVPLMLSDRVVVTPGEPDGADEVICERVPGPNLAAAALDALREAGWQAPPQRVEIEKRIPIAAGLGGGSADAAAVLRLAAGEVEGMERIAAAIGADATSQLEPRSLLVEGAGERLTPLPAAAEWAAVLIPDDAGLRTPDVFREADRLGLPRPAMELAALREQLLEAASEGASPLGYTELLVNDLGEAALSLRPEIGAALEALREAGAEHALITGSGPTAVGLFADIAKADAGASALPLRYSNAIVTGPLRAPLGG